MNQEENKIAAESTPISETAKNPGEPNGTPENTLPEVTLADLPHSWSEAMAHAGWTDLMPVQAKAMPYIMAGRDLMVQSRTGSGKTGAFVLPILERINPLLDATQALVLAPTRELAKQVCSDAKILAGDSGVRITAVYGGVKYGPQLAALKEGSHLVVGTPGRILDHLLRKSLTLNKLKILVFDEADRLLSMGFYPDMRQVQSYLPSHRVNGYMFSATFPPRVIGLASRFLHEPDFLSLSSENVHVIETEHVFYTVRGMDKDRSLVRLIEVENPDSAIIFCNTKAKVNYVATVLKRFGYDADEISSDLAQGAREKVMTRVRQGKLRFLVATDVAARGIDISQLSHVIQYEPPEDPEVYIHRAGRTGRAGASGVAVSLVDVIEKTKLNRIAQRYHIALEERPLPSDEDVAAIVSERTAVLLGTQRRDRDKLQTERMQRFVPLAQSMSETSEGLSLMAMLLDDYYQHSLHNPPPLPQPTPRPQKEKSRGRKRRRGRGRRRK